MNKYRKSVDWDAMRNDWVVGIKSVLQLSEEYGVSRAAILKHWKKEGVERNLSAKIKAKAESLVTHALVTPEVTLKTKVTEREIIEANAQGIALIDLEHRSDVRRSRNIVQKLLNELDDQVDNKELYEQLGELMNSADERGTDKLNEIYRKVISFGGRTDNVKKLADALRVLVELERKIVKLDDQPVQNDKQIGVEVSFV